MKKILLSPSSFGQVGNEPIEILEKKGFSLIHNPHGRRLTGDEVIHLAKECIGIVAGVEPLTARIMDALPNLKCISRVGVGIDNVDIEYAQSKGIFVTNTPEGPTRSVAEHTLAMTLSLLRKIPMAHNNLKQKIWKKEIGNLLLGKTIGVVGLGRIGKMVAEMFKALGNQVIGNDLVPDLHWAKQNEVEISGLQVLLKGADVVTLHVSGNKEKSYLLGRSEISSMKKGAFLINLSRGGVVDEKALFEALEGNRISGAGIDVFLDEPYEGPLCDLDNVVLTPHLGSYAKEAKLQMEIDAVNNLIRSLEGRT